MLDFPLELHSNLFRNVGVFRDELKKCAQAKMPFEVVMREIHSKFSHLNPEQFFELRYEFQEWSSVRLSKERSLAWESRARSNVLQLLVNRDKPDFTLNEIDRLFAELKGYTPPETLVGRPMSLKLGKITRKGSDDAPQA